MSTLLAGPIHSISLPEPELDLARASSASLLRLFRSSAKPVTLRFADPQSGDEVEATVPGAAMRVLGQALEQMAAGHSITLIPMQADLSTQQAAELMGV